jgi:putative addiction module antidote
MPHAHRPVKRLRRRRDIARHDSGGYTGVMVLELKLRKVGNSVGVVLPKEALAHLKVAEGDTICVTDAADGSLRMSPANAAFTLQMEAAEDIIRRYRNTLRALAK